MLGGFHVLTPAARERDDPQTFVGHLWLMSAGEWQVRLHVETNGLAVSSRWAKLQTSAGARDYQSVAAWIQRIGTQIPSFSDLWVPTATRGGQTSAGSASNFVTFSSTANITDNARSDRLDKAKRAAK